MRISGEIAFVTFPALSRNIMISPKRKSHKYQLVEGAAQALWASYRSLDFTECQGTSNGKGVPMGRLHTSPWVPGFRWAAGLRSSFPAVGYQPEMSKLIFPEPGCKKIVFCNQIIEFQTVLCLLTFDYAL